MRPEDFAARIDEADAWLRAGQFDEAIATGRELLPALKRDVDQTPDDPASWYQFALGLVLAHNRATYRRAAARRSSTSANQTTRALATRPAPA